VRHRQPVSTWVPVDPMILLTRLYKVDQLAPCALRAGVNLAERLPKECFQSRLSFALALSKLNPYRKQRESPIPAQGNAVNFSSARATKRFLLSRCASAIHIVRPLEINR
jgi:hypothetical protein